MWWYGYGWWWWWFAFVIIFFLIPLGYGWGYRGWGPWYRRRDFPSRRLNTSAGTLGTGVHSDVEPGWGWFGAFLWIVLVLAIVWLIAALI